MKYFLGLTLATLSLLVSSSLFSKEIEVKTKPNAVTVFLSGAEIQRETKVSIPKGVHQILFKGLSRYVDENSIQAGGKGNFTILSVTRKNDFFNALSGSPEFKKLDDSLKLLREEKELINGMVGVYNQERTMILQNQRVLHTETTNSSVTEVKAMADFYRSRLTEIAKLQIENTRKKTEIQQSINRINGQISQMRGKNKSSSTIIVEVSANATTSASVSVKYAVSNARWQPLYQIRANGQKESVEIANNAHITQTTGVDWKNVKLTLSTSNPRANTQMPTLNPWRLNFMPQYNTLQIQNQYSNRRSKMKEAKVMEFEENDNAADMTTTTITAADVPAAKRPVDFTFKVESEIDQRFEIKLPYDIPSDALPHHVNVSSVKPEATFEYTTIPKLKRETYLVCKVKDWAKYGLLSGQTNIYFNGTFVGKTYINASQTTNELPISMGIDKQITVKRERLEDFCESKLIGSNKKETIGIETTVKNTKSKTVIVIVKEHIPISSNSDIEVNLLEKSNAKYNAKTGMLSWKLELEPGASQAVIFKYEVKYPKDRKVNL